jgi:sodium transport system permease protein
MILIPVVLYPALILLVTQMAAVEHARLDETTGQVAFHGGDPPASLEQALSEHPQIQLVSNTAGSPRDIILSQTADCVIALSSDSRRDFEALEPVVLVVHHDASDDLSSTVRERTMGVLEDWLKEVREVRLAEVPRGRHSPASIRQENVASPARMGGHLLGQLVPLLLFATLVLGAFHPAVDLTAGEKERGTLLTLLTTPVNRTEIVLGKFAAVVTITLIAGLFNIGSLALFLGQAFPLMEASPDLTLHLPLERWLLLFVVVVAAGALFSAVMLAVAITARGFKEAQALLTPVAFACLIPGVLATMPGTELGPITTWIPSLNLALLAREILLGDASLLTFGAVLGTTALATSGFLLLAKTLFGRETVMVGGPPPRTLTDARGRVPGIGEGLAFFALLMSAVIYLGLPLQTKAPLTGLLFTLWGVLFGGTWLAVRVRGWDVRETFRLHRASGRAWLGALALGLGSWAILLAGVDLIQGEHLPIPEDIVEQARLLFEAERSPLGEALLLLAITVSPAICEELVFRGVILRSLRTALPTVLAVALSAALFAAMHLSIHRMLATFTLGCVAGGIVVATGSLLPAILFHGLHNTVAYGLAVMERGDTSPLGPDGLPTGVALASAVLLVVGGGTLLLHESRRRRDEDRARGLEERRSREIVESERHGGL